MEALEKETVSGHPVDRGQRLTMAGLSLAEDWMKVEMMAMGAGLAGRGTGLLYNRLTLTLKNPTWSYGPVPKGALGATSWTGEITIRPGLTGKLLGETVRHEAIHSLLSPRSPGFLQASRADLKAWGYWNSHLLRYLEEAAAETYATKSLSMGLKFPLTGGYGISMPRILLEGAGYTGVTGSASYGTYKLTEKALEK